MLQRSAASVEWMLTSAHALGEASTKQLEAPQNFLLRAYAVQLVVNEIEYHIGVGIWARGPPNRKREGVCRRLRRGLLARRLGAPGWLRSRSGPVHIIVPHSWLQPGDLQRAICSLPSHRRLRCPTRWGGADLETTRKRSWCTRAGQPGEKYTA
jgi:hypothetical protein